MKLSPGGRFLSKYTWYGSSRWPYGLLHVVSPLAKNIVNTSRAGTLGGQRPHQCIVVVF